MKTNPENHPAPSSEPTTTAETIRTLCDLLFELRVSSDVLARETGIDPGYLARSHAAFPVSSLIRLWEFAMEITGDEALALRLGDYFPRERTRYLVRLCRYSPTVMAAVRNWINRDNCANPAVRLELVDGERVGEIHLNLEEPSCHHCIWFAEHSFATALHLCRHLTRSPITAKAVDFRHPDPGYAQVYHQVFQAPVRFNRERSRMVMARTDMEKDVVCGHLRNGGMERKMGYAMEGESRGAGIRRKLRHHMRACLTRGDARLETVAGRMEMSRGQLYRLLRSDGTLFSDLLESLRKDLAREYLRQGIPAAQIARLLGFSSPRAFHHAFKRWFGMDTRDWLAAYMAS